MGILQHQVVRRAHYTWSITSIFWMAFASITEENYNFLSFFR